MKNRHRYHPPTRQKIMEAEANLSRSDQRAIRTGIRAATGEVKGEVDEGQMALASAILAVHPASMENLITAARATADKVIGDDYYTHVLFDLFGGDLVRTNKASKEYGEVVWYLNEVETAKAPLHKNRLGESMLSKLSPDAKIMVMDWIETQLWEYDYFEERAAYVMDIIDGGVTERKAE